MFLFEPTCLWYFLRWTTTFDQIRSERQKTAVCFQGRQTNWSCVFYYGHGTVSLMRQSRGWLLLACLCVPKCVFNAFTSIFPLAPSRDDVALETFIRREQMRRRQRYVMLFKPEELPISPGARARTFRKERGMRNPMSTRQERIQTNGDMIL